MPITKFFRKPALSNSRTAALLRWAKGENGNSLSGLATEFCFNLEHPEPLSAEETKTLVWLLSETFEPENFSDRPFLRGNVIEVGPRLSFQTAWSANAVSVCRSIGINKIKRIERTRRYKFSGIKNKKETAGIIPLLYDRMTECPYPKGITTFDPGIKPENWGIVPLIEEGKDALRNINRSMGLGLDDWDIDYYYDLFVNGMKRNPTTVECFDLGQSNSEHSRHWFFRGRLIIDGIEDPENLMQVIGKPYKTNPRNSVIAFKDNSSAIRGFPIKSIIPERPGSAGRFIEREFLYHPTLTAETHNFPSGVAPFPGAETGTGGRIRDVQAVGRGGLVIAGTAGYCVGNLRIPGYDMPWEERSFLYPGNLASPLTIEIEASNGASDYGNKFGEPLIQGYTRSFGLRLPDGERREWIKPIMFTAGAGQMDARHTEKNRPEKGMLVVKVGGPAYRIGMGGGAASSMIQGDNIEELDFNAVQRGDAEMEQKLNRVIRACVEMGDDNPIISIHDQGAGGCSNVLKEICDPEGARIEIRNIQLGDETLSVLEIWGAEYQEQNALLIKPEHKGLFESLCEREKVPVAFVGVITGDGKIVVHDGNDGTTPVDLDLKKVLAEMPQKTFRLERIKPKLRPFNPPDDIGETLRRALRLISVGSKRFLTNKVDRSVTGLIARQQCAGPLGLTVADVSVISQSHFGLTGMAISIGEQPIKGLINPEAMARMSVAEALTNMVWARITDMGDIRASANWMWAAKLPAEGARLRDAAVAMSNMMLKLGIAVDGGKDSLSMAAHVKETGETVKAPGALVISAYAPMEDVTKVLTPDFKNTGSAILYVDLGGGRDRLGGSALAQVYGEVGDSSPDIEDPLLLKKAFNVVQSLIEKETIVSGHDRSDGGLAVTLLEMAFSGNMGLSVNLETRNHPAAALFGEEAGLVMEIRLGREEEALRAFSSSGISAAIIGATSPEKRIHIAVNGNRVVQEDMRELRAVWEETSLELERLQSNPECADEEARNIYDRNAPAFKLTFTPEPAGDYNERPRVAIIREEGSNGDREMASAFQMAGFEPWDITITDLMRGHASLKEMRGAVFVGGFSYADVLDSAKGWAGAIKFNKKLRSEFDAFYERKDTFSLGICNGCQLMALLGWVPWRGIAEKSQPRFIHNKSGRFESRFATLLIGQSPSIMLKEMEGSVLGVWVAHGEGMAHFPDEEIFTRVIKDRLVPAYYADDDGSPTEAYPLNPNGSPFGIAGLCSPDGRHLAMMPHPERAFLKWQWAWMPEDWKKNLKTSPWLRMFQNARAWCGGK